MCRLPLDGPEGAELLGLAAELNALAARQRTLLERRAVLVSVLRARRLPLVRPPQATTPPSAQGALLTAGGLLILLAGAVFTLVNWSRFGIGGRAAVLAALTCAVFAAPVPLRRRRLDATAETTRAVGLGLVLLDAYAARAAGLGGLDSLGPDGYWAGVTALAAAGAAAYGWRGGSRVLPYAALLLAQLPAVLLADAAHAHLTGLAYALLANAVLSFAVAVRTRLRYAAEAAAGWAVAGGGTAWLAGEHAGSYGPALRASAPLLLAAAFGLLWARTERAPGRLHAATAAGLALVGTAQVLARQGVPAAWSAAAWAIPAALLAGAVLAVTPAEAWRHHAERRGLLRAGAALLGLAGVWELPPLLRAFTAPVVHGTWQVAGVVPVVAALCAAVAAGAAARFRRPDAWCGAAVAGVAAVESASLAASWPNPLPLALAGALALAAAAPLLRSPATSAPWLCVLLTAAGTALWWSLPDDTAALTVWAAAAVLACAFTAANRYPAPSGAFAVGALTVEAIRASTTAGLPLYMAAFPVLAVAAATIPAAARLTATAAPALPADEKPTAPGTASAGAPGTSAEPTDPTPDTPPAPAGQPTTTAAPGTSAEQADPTPDTPATDADPAAAQPTTTAAPGTSAEPADPTPDTPATPAPTDADPAAAQPATTAAPGTSAAHPAAQPVAGPVGPATGASGVPSGGPRVVGWPAGPALPGPGLAVYAKAFLPAPLSPALTVEVGGYLAGFVALCLSAGNADVLSLVLALAGAAAGGVALRPGRRAAGVVAAMLVAASSWVRLGLAGVHAPEAYTVSVSCVLLGLGWVRRRRDPGVGSYAAYGGGLAATLGPSLVAAWGDAHWQRPLLLGLGALAVTLLGARHRLRAPLLLGGAALVADAVHELAPTVVQSLGLLPRWVPVALAGALLVYVGATYERRLVDARRVRRGYRALN